MHSVYQVATTAFLQTVDSQFSNICSLLPARSVDKASSLKKKTVNAWIRMAFVASETYPLRFKTFFLEQAFVGVRTPDTSYAQSPPPAPPPPSKLGVQTTPWLSRRRPSDTDPPVGARLTALVHRRPDERHSLERVLANDHVLGHAVPEVAVPPPLFHYRDPRLKVEGPRQGPQAEKNAP